MAYNSQLAITFVILFLTLNIPYLGKAQDRKQFNSYSQILNEEDARRIINQWHEEINKTDNNELINELSTEIIEVAQQFDLREDLVRGHLYKAKIAQSRLQLRAQKKHLDHAYHVSDKARPLIDQIDILKVDYFLTMHDGDSAIFYANKRAIYQQTLGDSLEIFKIKLDKSRGYLLLREFATSLQYAEEALGYFNNSSNKTLKNTAILYTSRALHYNNNEEKGRALLFQIIEGSNDQSLIKAKALYYLSFDLMRDKQFQDAFEFQKKCLEIYKNHEYEFANRSETYLLAYDIHTKTGDMDKAYQYLVKASQEIENTDIAPAIIHFLEHKSRYYMGRDNLKVALSTLIELKEYENSLNRKFDPYTTMLVSRVYYASGNQEQAILEAKDALRRTNPDDYLNLNNIYRRLCLIYKAENDYKKAYETALLLMEVIERQNIANGEKRTKDFMIQLETREKEEKIKEITEEKAIALEEYRFNIQRIFFVGIIVILVSLLGFLFYSYNKRKKQLILEQKNISQHEIILVKNRILETLSHELRTPLGAVLGYLQLIKTKSLSPTEVSRYSDLATRSSYSILNNLESFLTLWKKNEYGKISDFRTMKKFEEFFCATLLNFESSIKLKSQALLYRTNIFTTQMIDLEYDKLTKIINNLISNAIKYSANGKEILVSVILRVDTLYIEIKDQGMGISSRDQKKIFDQFFQIHTNHTNNGFGIGLSLVNELCTSLGGKVTVESTEFVGSTFTVEIPLKNDVLDHLKILKEDVSYITLIGKEDQLQKHENKNFPNVLIVDDNLEMQQYLNIVLEGFLNCYNAANGVQALKQMENQKFDLIISDYKMPDMNGLEFKEHLNKNPEWAIIPFILLTATVFEKRGDVSFQYGINDYILKPFSHNEILASTRFLLNNKINTTKVLSLDDTNIQYSNHLSDLMDKINLVIKKNISNSKYSIGELAQECNYSQKQLSRIVKDSTGLTLVKLILEIRLTMAYEMIVNKKYPTIMEVIYAVGLTSRSYFNKKFVERFGIKPNDISK